MTGHVAIARAAPRILLRPPRRGSLGGGAAAGLCLLGTLAAAAYAWRAAAPELWLQTRLLADGDPALSRPFLASLALRFAPLPGQPVTLAEGGRALLVTVHARTAASAQGRLRSFVTILDAAPAPQAAPAPAADRRAPLIADRTQLQAEAAALDARAASASASLTAVARDLAASARDAVTVRTGRTTVEKGADALADMQIQRFQLLSRYQADYPAVLTLDGQIRELKTFLADQSRRLATAPATSAPADAVLLGERDRLRAELAGIDERRAALVAQTATLDQALAAPRPAAPPPPPPVLLVEAATTAGHAPDHRPLLLGAIGLAGCALAALAWLLGRRSAPAWAVAPQPLALGAGAVPLLTAIPKLRVPELDPRSQATARRPD